MYFWIRNVSFCMCSHCGWLLLKCFTIGLGWNGAETNCGISAHILDIVVMNSFTTAYRYFEQQQCRVCSLWIWLNERLLMRYIHLSVNLAKVTVSSKVVRGQEHGVRIRLGNWLNKIWPINSNSCLLVTQIRQKRSVSIALFWKFFIYNNSICIKVHGKKKDESKKGFNREELNPPSAL